MLKYFFVIFFLLVTAILANLRLKLKFCILKQNSEKMGFWAKYWPFIFVKISLEHINFSFVHEYLDIYAPFKSLADHSDLCP